MRFDLLLVHSRFRGLLHVAGLPQPVRLDVLLQGARSLFLRRMFTHAHHVSAWCSLAGFVPVKQNLLWIWFMVLQCGDAPTRLCFSA